MKYKCKICNKEHEIYFGIKVEQSNTLTAILDDDKKRVLELEKDCYLVDKSKVVLPSMLEIKTEYDSPFWYEKWVEIKWETFSNMADSFINSKGAKIEGKLYDDIIPYYPDSKGLKCKIEFLPNSTVKDRSRITILEKSQLKLDQEEGISNSRFEELIQIIHHNPKAKK